MACCGLVAALSTVAALGPALLLLLPPSPLLSCSQTSVFCMTRGDVVWLRKRGATLAQREGPASAVARTLHCRTLLYTSPSVRVGLGSMGQGLCAMRSDASAGKRLVRQHARAATWAMAHYKVS